MGVMGVVVAPLAGSVDRNVSFTQHVKILDVAPLAGSVDRNIKQGPMNATVYGRSPRGERG